MLDAAKTSRTVALRASSPLRIATRVNAHEHTSTCLDLYDGQPRMTEDYDDVLRAEPPPANEEVVARNRLWLEVASRSRIADDSEVQVVERGQAIDLVVTRRGVGPIRNHAGSFFVLDFEVSDRWRKYMVVLAGTLDARFGPIFDPSIPVLLRIDSGCETGQILHDETCECREQMHEALRQIAGHGQGLLISIPAQDGRGLGLPFKLATLTLQTQLGFDTVRASALLDPAGDRDHRTYAGAVAVLAALGISPKFRVTLMTNNPDKASVLRENYYTVDTQPLIVGVTDANRLHLRAKHEELGHQGLDLEHSDSGD